LGLSTLIYAFWMGSLGVFLVVIEVEGLEVKGLLFDWGLGILD
jgi:hypothetical protein